jgi:hypothetical protein
MVLAVFEGWMLIDFVLVFAAIDKMISPRNGLLVQLVGLCQRSGTATRLMVKQRQRVMWARNKSTQWEQTMVARDKSKQ